MINVSPYACKYMDVDIDGVVTAFARLKDRRLGLRRLTNLVNLVDGVTVLPFFPFILYFTDNFRYKEKKQLTTAFSFVFSY